MTNKYEFNITLSESEKTKLKKKKISKSRKKNILKKMKRKGPVE